MMRHPMAIFIERFNSEKRVKAMMELIDLWNSRPLKPDSIITEFRNILIEEGYPINVTRTSSLETIQEYAVRRVIELSVPSMQTHI